jgi:hypothetical protein
MLKACIMSIKNSNPQPQAVERIIKKKEDKHPTNLNGSEMGKSPKEKEEMVNIRNKNRGQ